MKKDIEFIKGRWYKFNNDSKKLHYFKVGYEDLNLNESYPIKTIEDITSDIYKNRSNGWEFSLFSRLVEDLSEIAQFLPKGHPDLKPKTYELW